MSYVAPSWWSQDAAVSVQPPQSVQSGKHGPRPAMDADSVARGLKEQMELRAQLKEEQRRREREEVLAALAREREIAEEEKRRATDSVMLKKMQLRADLDVQIQQRKIDQMRRYEQKHYDLEEQVDSLAAWKREQEEIKAAKRAKQEEFQMERKQAILDSEAKKRELILKKQAEDRIQAEAFNSMLDAQDTKRREFFKKLGGTVAEAKQPTVSAAHTHTPPISKVEHVALLKEQMDEKKRRIQAEKDADFAYAQALKMQIEAAQREEEAKKRERLEKNRVFRGYLEEQMTHQRQASRSSRPW